MDINSRLHKGLDVLANLLHVRHAEAEPVRPADTTADPMEDDPVDPEDDWDDDEDE